MFGLGFLVCMDEQRQVRAYHNVCSHRAMAVATGDGRAPLCEGGGVMSGLRFECPYHGWQFDMEGRFRGCKIANGLAGIRNFTPETSSLWPIRCEVWGPLVFLHLGDHTDLPSVAEVMGAGGELLASEGLKDDDWVFHKRVEYPMACNWKCMVDNYEDGNYHVYLAHSHLINCFYMDASHNDLFDNMTSMWGPNVPKPEWPASGLPGAEGYNIMESRTRGGKDQSYSMLYPNVFWNRYGIWHSVTNVTPTGVDSCLTTFDLFFKKETLADTDFVAKCVAAEDHLQKEDIDLCLRVSENLRNPRYDAGRYAPIEAPMWFFHQKLHKSIFGTAPGLKHRPGGSNRNYYKDA